MKTKNTIRDSVIFVLGYCLIMLPVFLFAQETNVPPFVPPDAIDPVTAPLPKSMIEYWQFAIPIVVPLVVAFLKWVGPKIPRRVIPIISPALGIGLGLVMQAITNAEFSWMTTTLSGLLGWAATGLREAVDQNIVQPQQPPEEKIAELKEKIEEVKENPSATT